MEHLTIKMDPKPEVVQLATIGLPGPKLRYQDLTESDKEDLRRGIYESIQVQLDAAEEAQEGAENARDVSLNTMTRIQDVLLPAVTNLFNETTTAKNDAEVARSGAQSAQAAAAASATASSSSATQARAAQTAAESARDNAQSSASASAASATQSANSATASANSASTAESHKNDAQASAQAAAASATESSGYADESKGYRDQSQQYAEQARLTVESTVQSLGVWEPDGGTEYPATPTRDTRWTLKISTPTYTFTSGDLQGEQCQDGDTLFYDHNLGQFDLLATGSVVLGNIVQSITDAQGNVNESPNVTIDADFVDAVSKSNGGTFNKKVTFAGDMALTTTSNLQSSSGFNLVNCPGSTVNLGSTQLKSIIRSNTNPVVQVGAQGEREIYHKGNKPTAAEVGALPSDWRPRFEQITNLPDTLVFTDKNNSFNGVQDFFGRVRVFANDDTTINHQFETVNNVATYRTDASNAWRMFGPNSTFLYANHINSILDTVNYDLYEKGERVYSPNNKPDAIDVGAVRELKWLAKVLPNQWSSIAKFSSDETLSGQAIVTVSHTRRGVVVNSRFLIYWGHPNADNACIVLLASNPYSQIKVRLRGDDSYGGGVFFEILDENVNSPTLSEYGYTVMVDALYGEIELLTEITQGSSGDKVTPVVQTEPKVIKINDYKVYHEGFKPTPEDVNAVPMLLVDNHKIAAVHATLNRDAVLELMGDNESNGFKLYYRGGSDNYTQMVVRDGGTDKAVVNIPREGNFIDVLTDLRVNGQGVYSPNNKPSPTAIGAEPALSPEQKRNIYMNSGAPDAAIGANGDLYIET